MRVSEPAPPKLNREIVLFRFCVRARGAAHVVSGSRAASFIFCIFDLVGFSERDLRENF